MSFKISEQAQKKAEELLNYYPDKKSAVMPLLFIVQEENNYISEDGVAWVSKLTEIPPVHINELVTFYTMYKDKPKGKYHIQVCRTLSCAVLGAKNVVECFKKKLGINLNEVSNDGMWSMEEVECLGSCGTGPMCEINDTYFENLTEEKIEKIINAIEEQQPDLSFSTVKDKLGEGLKEFAKSEVHFCKGCSK